MTGKRIAMYRRIAEQVENREVVHIPCASIRMVRDSIEMLRELKIPFRVEANLVLGYEPKIGFSKSGHYRILHSKRRQLLIIVS